MSTVSKITQLDRYEMVNHNERHLFSSRCSKSQHSLCSGRVNKRRCPDGICKCDCHKGLSIADRIELKNYRCMKHSKYFERLNKQ